MRIILGSVINYDKLSSGIRLIQNAPERLREVVRMVVCRNDDSDKRCL